jgi:DNA (cytosine-5)-methyltransferase 1
MKNNTPRLVEDAFNKFASLPRQRNFLRTTATPNIADPPAVLATATDIRITYGRQIVVSGVLPTIKYFLRLLPDTATFLTAYTLALRNDYEAGTDLKEVHLRRWQEILEEYAFVTSAERSEP